jgi:hypothetical protein
LFEPFCSVQKYIFCSIKPRFFVVNWLSCIVKCNTFSVAPSIFNQNAKNVLFYWQSLLYKSTKCMSDKWFLSRRRRTESNQEKFWEFLSNSQKIEIMTLSEITLLKIPSKGAFTRQIFTVRFWSLLTYFGPCMHHKALIHTWCWSGAKWCNFNR